MKEFETIAAISTPLGKSGVSIIKISGDKSLEVINKIFVGGNKKPIDRFKPWMLNYGFIRNKDNDEILDEVLVSYFKSPKSFTAEDVVEINCHGGKTSTELVLNEVFKAGARPAEAGEFTKRAFLNGRIDLSQAEAVIDIINAKTEKSIKSALKQSEGELSSRVGSIRNELLDILAFIEVTVDFPEEDLEFTTSEEVSEKVEVLVKEIEKILSTSSEGKILREGLSMALVGKPNVGKSSLLNELLSENRAIVTDIPGTTRDIIEEYLNIDGIPIKITDTAGIRSTEDVIEKIGVDRSRSKIEEADLVVFVLDRSKELEKEDLEILEFIGDKEKIVLLNKSDLHKKIDLENLGIEHFVEISALSGSGIDKLKNEIKEIFFKDNFMESEILVSNQRHIEALMRAKESLVEGKNAVDAGISLDLAGIDLNAAWSYLGEITGDTLSENLIDKIFSDFCIGK
ncbi:MAG: tRNA uridine-5-carboxymethylaminomethyl(34) synthesis GTPase MnmE [Clostridium sp.]|nr:tRNA uridine-5-carboxymethylaminomethyl(34) synthesis GTPase MnmE [Clostridium sp.]